MCDKGTIKRAPSVLKMASLVFSKETDLIAPHRTHLFSFFCLFTMDGLSKARKLASWRHGSGPFIRDGCCHNVKIIALTWVGPLNYKKVLFSKNFPHFGLLK